MCGAAPRVAGHACPTDIYLPAGCLAQTRTYVYITYISSRVESNRHHTTADSDAQPTGEGGGGGSGGNRNTPLTSHQRCLNGITRPGARVGVASSPQSASSASSRPSRFSAPIFVVCRLAPPAFLWLERKSVTHRYLWLKSRWRSEIEAETPLAFLRLGSLWLQTGSSCLPAAYC
jgi:hypothetical protein